MLQDLSDPSNYHEFCRLLARLKTNYQLGELVKVTIYPELIKRIAEFTVTSLRVRIFKWIKKGTNMHICNGGLYKCPFITEISDKCNKL